MNKNYIEQNKKAYNELAHEYATRFYAFNREFYMREVFDTVNFQSGQTLLEIGPGKGEKAKLFCDYGLSVTAVELSEEMCKVCAQTAPDVNLINKNIFDCNFTEKFNYIYMEAVIHNFPIEDAKKLLNLVKTWLKDDGLIIITTTVDTLDKEGYESKKDYKSNIERFRHRYTKESFIDLILSCDFDIIDKRYKEEKDDIRHKIWQILYLKKQTTR